MTAVGNDAERTTRLILDAELQSGRLAESDVKAASRAWPSNSGNPMRATRAAQRMAMKCGLKDGVRSMLDGSLAVRREALGADAKGPPRFLIRVDEFPYSSAFDQPERYGVDPTRIFHEIMTEAGIPYLMGVVSQLTHAYLDVDAEGGRDLDEGERELLDQMRTDGVVFAQHGATHRTRFRSPRRYSELGGLGSAVGPLLDDAREKLKEMGVETRILIPPFNRFDREQWPTLAERYSVITGGPESVPLVGAQPSPAWWGSAVFVPAYAPLYAGAGTILGSLDKIIALEPGCWVPLVLHTAWEADAGFDALRRLVERLAPYAVHWSKFLDAVDRSAGALVG
jgi:Uncharacterized protein conserved in bacteria (DUF2334)